MTPRRYLAAEQIKLVPPFTKADLVSALTVILMVGSGAYALALVLP